MSWTTKRQLRAQLEVQNTIIVELRTELLRRHCGFALPPTGLPWRSLDSEGDSIEVRRAQDDPEVVIVRTSWKTDEPGRALVTSVALETWQKRKECAAAILAMGPPDVTEERPSLSLIQGLG